MKILLTLTPDFFPSAFKWTPPTSLLYLGAVIEQTGHEVRIVDPIHLGLSPKDLVRLVEEQAPDVFGVYVTSDTYFIAADLIKAVKRRLPRTVVMAGGPHPTLLAGKMFENLPELDVVVRGEGERAVPLILDRLANGESLEDIPNTSFRADGQVVHCQRQELIEDLDSVPFPAYHLIDFPAYDYTQPVRGQGDVKAINIITSRGCPFNCLFCSNTNLFAKRVRRRSTANIIAEMKLWKERYGVRYFWIQDDAFNLSRTKTLEFCDSLLAEKLDVFWYSIMRADNATPELLSRMKEAGFVGGSFSIETIDERLRQEVLGKSLTDKQVLDAVDLFNRLDLYCNINFLVSIPDETRESMERNITFIENLRFANPTSSANVNILRIYPGTRLEQLARERGLIREGFSWFDEKRMRKYSPGVFPGLYGAVPIYREHLRFVDIFSFLFRWKYSPNIRLDPGRSSSMLTYLRHYLRRTRTLKDLYILSQIARAFLAVNLRRLFKR